MKYLPLILCLVSAPALAQLTTTHAGTATGTTFTVTPLLSWGGGTAAPSASAVNYGLVTGNVNTPSFYGVTLGARTNPIPIDANISNLEINFPGVTITTGSYTIGLNAAGSAQSLSCALTTSTSSCSDTVDSYHATPGTAFTWEVQPGVPTTCGAGCTALAGLGELSATLTSTVGNESAIFCGTNGLGAASATAINYSACGSAASPGAAPESTQSMIISEAGTIDQLYVVMSAASGAGSAYAMALFHNGTVTSLVATCANVTTCSDTNAGHSFTVSAGDTISLAICPTAASQLAAWCSALTTVPTARSAATGVRFVPTSPGKSMISTTNPGTTTDSVSSRFVPLSGDGNDSTTNNGLNIPPFLNGKTITLSNMIAAQCPGPGTPTRTVTLYGNLSAQTPVAVIPSGSTACPTMTSNQDNTHTYNMVQGNSLSVGHVLSTLTGDSVTATFKVTVSALVH